LKKTLLFALCIASISSKANETQTDESLDITNSNIEVSNISQTNISNEESIVNEIASKNIEFPHYAVGISYLKNQDLPYDLEKALFWLAQSSEIEKNEKADYLIAEMYFKGQVPSGVVDYDKAMFFYERAASRGNLEAKLKLSSIYLFDEVLYNQEKGLKWLNDAKMNNSSTAYLFYYLLTLNKDDFKTIEKSLNFHEHSNTKESNFTLGYLYLTGKGVERNFEKSKSYFRKSLAQGISISEIFIVQIDKIISSLNEKKLK
jgi:TPR repeat protein